MSRMYSRDEVEALFLIDEFARYYHLYNENVGIFELYEEFCHSKYNIAYRDIETCVASWIAYKTGMITNGFN